MVCLLAALAPAADVAADTTDNHRELTLWYRNYDSPAIRNLVTLALDKTPEYGSYELRRSLEVSQGRALLELTKSSNRILDIANVASTAEREASLNPIPVPVDGGLLGFRVCLVVPDNLQKFKEVSSLDDLKARKVSIGQGTHWPDTPILEANGLTVITNPRFEVLLAMALNQRFDCFARGISEVLYDLEQPRAKGLVVEPDLLIAYPLPSYLFAAKYDHDTAHRLQLGIERAIEDGSFADYLRKHFGRAMKELNLKHRTIITLKNPYLSDESNGIGRKTLEELTRRIQYLEQ
jgi:hypothetical protein